jgi:hypothetical protein
MYVHIIKILGLKYVEAYFNILRLLALLALF